MPAIDRCCFCLRFRDAIILISLISMAFSFTGLMVSILSIFQIFEYPEEQLTLWMLQVILYLGIHGLVFQSILLLVSILLFWGAIKEVPTLLLAWICFAPFIILAMVVNIVLVQEKSSDLAVPIICFAIIFAIFVVNAAVIIVQYYKELMRNEQRLKFLESVTGSHLRQTPLQRIAAIFGATRPVMVSGAQVIPQSSSPPTMSSASYPPQFPLQSPLVTERQAMRSILSETYAKMLMASQPPPNARPPI